MAHDRTELAVLAVPVVSAAVGVVGFCLGIPIAQAQFPCVVALVWAWTMCGSMREAVGYAVVEILLLAATAFSFSYSFGDVASCWFPMQRMMVEGWNPIWQSDPAAIDAVLEGLGAAKSHILVYPKLAPLVGAVVAKGTGLFAGDAFLPYSLAFVLWRVAARFARRYGSVGSFGAQALAAALVVTPKVTNAIVGYVDYTVYAAFMLVLLSGWLAKDSDDRGEFAVTALSWIVLMCVKANGMLFALLLAAGLLCRTKGDPRRALARSFVAAGFVCLVLSINPIVPLLRCFVISGSPWTDLTGDFGGNADAMQMGRFARMVYAWVSPALVPGHPRFDVFGGVAGFGLWFNVLLAASVLAISCTRGGTSMILAVMIFVTSNSLPLKYIGYQRYCPQMWAIPALAAFGLVMHPRPFLARREGLVKVLRVFVLVSLSAVACGLAVRACGYFVDEIQLERGRRRLLAQLREQPAGVVRMDPGLRDSACAYSISRRLQAAGLTVDDSAGGPTVGFDASARQLTADFAQVMPGEHEQ